MSSSSSVRTVRGEMEYQALSTSRRSAHIGFGSVASVLLLALGWTLTRRMSALRSFVTDDSYITYLYGRNLAEGYGLRYNPNDAAPTEGFSSLLHVLFAAVAELAGVDPLASTRALSLLLLLSVPVVAALALARPLGVSRSVLLFAGVCAHSVFSLLPETGLHLSSGMDTMLFTALQAWLYVWAARLALVDEPPSGLFLALGFGLIASLSLARPEGVLLSAGYLVIGVVARLWLSPAKDCFGLAKRAAVFVGICTAAGAAFLGWKLVYLEQLLPNAYYVKSHNAIFGRSGEFLPGLGETIAFGIERYLPSAVLLAILALWQRRLERVRVLVALLVPSALVIGLYARAIHEVAFGYRYEYGQLLQLELCGALCLALLWSRARVAFVVLSAALVVGALLLDPAALRMATSPLSNPRLLPTAWVTYRPSDHSNPHARLGLDLADTQLGQDAKLLVGSAGMIPYHSRFFALDWAGLNTPHLSGREPLSIEEVSAYLESFEADVVASPFPAATEGHSSPAGDPAFQSWSVQSLFDASQSSLINSWDRERVEQLLYRQMLLVRDEYVFGALYAFSSRWAMIAWVRRDSPHSERILEQLRRSTRRDRGIDLTPFYGSDPRGRALAEDPLP